MDLATVVEEVAELVTADELWQMGSQGDNFELVRGELYEMAPPGGTYGRTASRLDTRLANFVETHRLGEVMVESGYKLTSSPDTVRAPDVSFLSATRIPAGGLPEGYIDGPPDLAVEIVSPGDTASEIQNKVQDYLAAGARLVWVIYPAQRLVMVHYPDSTARTLRQTDMLSGELVLPGFTCQVEELFA
jgi:Uma2 family endonuclease